MLRRNLIQLALKTIDLESESGYPLISILFDLIDTYDLPFESLCFFKQVFVHFLHLVTLHFELLLQCTVFF